MFHPDIQTLRREFKKIPMQRSIFNKILGVWIADQTQAQVFDIFSIETKTKE